MSVTVGNVSLNGTNQSIQNHGIMDMPKGQKPLNVFLFCLTFIITFTALLGSIYSLVSLLRLQNKSTISMIVTSLTVDDLISVVPVTIFMLKQWLDEMLPHTLCTTSALLYLFQGFSSNLMGSLVVSYNFYSLHKTGTSHRATKRPVSMIWAILTIWIVSLLICILPLFGWGSYSPTSWGCLMDCASSYVLLLFGIYVLCLCLLVVLSIPLIYKLLCSDDQQQLYDDYHQIVRGYFSPGSPPAGSHALSLSPEDPVNRLSKHCQVPCQNSDPLVRQSPTDISGADHYGAHCVPYTSRGFTVEFAQKRFSLILALIKVILWLPMMIQMVVQHTVAFQSFSFEIFSFLLTLLAVTVTPVFVLSEYWSHLPCGCIINCRRNVYTISSQEGKPKRRGFEFNLSFQQGYGIYKISHDIYHSDDGNSVSYHSLLNYDCENAKETQKENNTIEFSTISLEDSSILKDSAKRNRTVGTDTKQDLGKDKVTDHLLAVKTGTHKREDIRNMEKGPFFEGPERRLSHEECRKPELSDWEWCRSKSERTPRQRSGGSLAIPLCAFQGTVSLHAPTGKTLSLSTYEVSTEGQKITPTSKKIEVYRSKSVGHEPNAEDSPTTFADTNVKIHLEVLEICDNEEAMDTVSIISNISQSSTQVRSPSLRYSRKENRFVSCDLGETASYTLFIPSNNPDSDINISIPDTVEAHRQNSKKQHMEKDGYQEEIQVLNKAYRKREEDEGSS
ncbi:probable G-protein coupled receptor 149 [Sphaerodactylus townsendi]|uniref:probable G-protein coupled receptor 149 n=1 Tax=Sphaerodactylus townsendi TaxID=933632 RepID=UPI002026AF49|nr:probable G-protein coupled receptor 149 [Sphaerodactylus townsendi]